MIFKGIKAKLILLTSIQAIGIVLVGILGSTAVFKLSNNINFVIVNSLPIVRTIALIDMVHDGVRGAVFEAVLGAEKKDPAKIEEAKKTLAEHTENINNYFKIIISKEITPDLKEKMNENIKELTSYLDSAKDVIVASEESPDKLNELLENFQNKFESLETNLEKFADTVDEKNKTYFSSVIREGKHYSISLLIIIISTLIISLIITYIVSKKLISSLLHVSDSLALESSALGEASTSLFSAAQDQAHSTQQQATVLEKTSAAVEEISAMVRKSASIASEAELKSNDSRDNAEKGNEIVQKMGKSIDEINEINNEIALNMRANMDKFSHVLSIINEVNSKTKIINDIVFQTKILSFNASVESARAGEHGKGFAVVAEEVGNLANMSGSAAKEINILLDNSLSTVSKIIDETKISVDSLISKASEKVKQGSIVTHECGDVLQDIVSTVQSVSQMMSNITLANQESSKGVEEIAKAMHVLNSTTQSNTQSASSTTTNAKNLSQQMSNLQGVSSELNYIVSGDQKISTPD